MASKIKVDELETADGTGTIALQNQLSGMTTASLPSTLLASQMPAGSVIQVVQLSAGIDRTTISSTGSWTTHYGVAITPSATSSKIMISINLPVSIAGSSNMLRAGFRLQRGSTTLLNTDDFTEQMQARNADGEHNQVFSTLYLDSPSTTSATTYNIQGNLMTGSSMLMFETGKGTNMILMEIKG